MVFLDGSGWTPDGTFVFTDRAWYLGALEKKGDIYTPSEPYVDASTGKTCLACAVMLRDGVVLSSDVNFDKVAEKLNSFESVSPDARFYIINKETKDILVSTDQSIVGQNLSNTTDGIMQGLATVFDKLNTDSKMSADKVVTQKTPAGAMMFTSTDIEGTSWVVVSAVPSTYMSNMIVRVMMITFISALIPSRNTQLVLFLVISKAINPVTKVNQEHYRYQWR